MQNANLFLKKSLAVKFMLTDAWQKTYIQFTLL